jgi:poly-D-alanine transfer protein DltD
MLTKLADSKILLRKNSTYTESPEFECLQKILNKFLGKQGACTQSQI